MNIDAEKRDHRMDNNPEYWQHSEASLQFHKVPPCLHLFVSCLGTPHNIASSKMAVCFAAFLTSWSVTGSQRTAFLHKRALKDPGLHDLCTASSPDMTEDVSRSPRPVLLQDFEAAKARQDRSLDTIDKGLTTLRGIGEAMGETLRQQDVVLDAIHERVRPHPPGAWAIGICRNV